MKKVLFLLLSLLILFGIPPVMSGNAQIVETGWSQPVRLSSRLPIGEPARMVSDPYGFLHVLWTEVQPDASTVIFYTRFDGETWSVPIDVYVTPKNFSINSLRPIVDEYGFLQLVWTQGVIAKRMFFTKVSVYETLSANKWQEPRQTTIPAEDVILQIDSDGIYHILFSRIDPEARGVYYINSDDEGGTWSNPLWLDPNIPPGLYPRGLNFSLDDEGGMHALWQYAIFDENAIGGTTNWIYYTHKLKGEEQWTNFTIDRADETNAGSGYQLNAAGPVMIVSGQTVHVIWAGGILHYRHHRYSTDAGRTWTRSTRIWGGLNGQAFDGFTLDSKGRIHYFAQIRFPLGIYYAVWENGRWIEPSMVYFVRFSDSDPPSDQVEAHATYPAILGDTLVLTFTDPPPHATRGLYMTTMKLDDMEPVSPITPPAPVPTPTLEVPATQEPTVTPFVTAMANALLIEAPPPPQGVSSVPGQAFVLGTILSLLVIGGIFVFRIFKR